MKSKQITPGIIALILTQLLSSKTMAQCCVAPVDLMVITIPLISGYPFPMQIGVIADYRWQRVKQAGCSTPVKYKLQWRRVGDTAWINRILTTTPDAGFVEYTDTCRIRCCTGGICSSKREWRVQGICSAISKTTWVRGATFKPAFTTPIVTASSASDASVQGKFTIAAYPNPVAGELKLSGSLKAGGPVNVQIINSVGQTVLRRDYNFNTGNFNAGIDVSKLPPGVYLVVVNDKTERTTLSIVKQ